MLRALITVNYRESYGLFAVSGILFNHESPPWAEFVTRKATPGLRSSSAGRKPTDGTLTPGALLAGNVRAMWLMLQQERPEDYVVATGVQHSVRELLECAFGYVGLD